MGVFSKKTNILILIFFVASVLFVIYSLIFGGNDNDSGKVNGYTPEQVAIYSTSEYLVHDYNKFYTVEEIIKQFILAMSDKKYKAIYANTSSDIVGDISKDEYAKLLEDFYADNFSDIKDEQGNVVTAYSNTRNLEYLYAISDKKYIASVKNNHGTTTKIGLQLKSNNVYEIMYLEF